MERKKEQSKRVSPIAHVINFPANLIDRFFWRVCKVNHYSIQGQEIVLQRGPFANTSIQSDRIVQWSIHPEMGFDVVRINLEGGEMLTWIDTYGDLLAALETLASVKQSH